MDPDFLPIPKSRIQRSKRHRIPDLDPQNCLPEIQLLWMDVRAWPAGWEDVVARKLVHIPQVEILLQHNSALEASALGHLGGKS
jgi:hypothetical protein